MTFLPGWDSIEVTTAASKWLSYLGFLALLIAVGLQLLGYVYQQRRDLLLSERSARHERVLPQEEARNLAARMRKYSGTHFKIVTETNDYNQNSEPVRFSRQLSSLLVHSGWIPTDEILDEGKFTRVYVRVANRGILIAYRGDDNASKATADGVRAELGYFGISCSLDPVSDLRAGRLLFQIGFA